MQLIKLEERIKSRSVMSSLEIAELTGKRHDLVLRDVRNLISELNGVLKIEESKYVNKQNKKQPCLLLDKEATLLLTSGYSVALRLKIIRRVFELESKNGSLRARIKAAHDDMELIKHNGSIWGKAGVIQRKQKQESRLVLNKLLSQAQLKLF